MLDFHAWVTPFNWQSQSFDLKAVSKMLARVRRLVKHFHKSSKESYLQIGRETTALGCAPTQTQR